MSMSSAPTVATEEDSPEQIALDRLIAEQEQIFLDRTGQSLRLTESAKASLAGGVASSWQDAPPGTVWIDRGAGSHVWDADGTEYVDLHAGFGVNVVGHAHPAIVRAVSGRVTLGTHFAQPTSDVIDVSVELARRFRLPLWRFGNSGTEATMDAVHLMRVATGRSKILKVEGSYHGHHDSVQVSVYPEPEDAGPAARPNSVGVSSVPKDFTRLTVVVPFGDLAAVEQALADHPDEIAGMIIEPFMMNIGLIAPPDGYLAGLKALLNSHGAYLAFDEVKTGLGLAAGGAVELTGVVPDIVCLAKALGGGVPCGAIGATEELMRLISDRVYEQVGTFNGNPLTMAAAKAVLTEILTEDAYAHFDRLRAIMVAGAEDILRRYELPGYVVAYGSKGAVIFTDRLRDYRDFLAYDDRWGNAHWLYQHNGGVFLPPWGKCEQWTLSVQHTEDDARRFVANLETFAADLRGGRRA
ncbi:MAG: aminotransferase class III-fold pyridoxal phosphate-dependent enzyme [Sporichthyaceae bacterium]|nr:aminotransferase class III-fold pyridoxal phosphate-dependent enzyme [Sporichthyaceae bacterium]